MRIIPRTHTSGKQGFSDYDDLKPGEAVFNDEIKAAQRDTTQAIPIELEANQCSLHDGRIIHGSEPNTSSKRRCGYTMRFVSTRVRANHEQIGAWHHLYLVRGKDHAGNVYGDTTKAYPELARFRAKQRPISCSPQLAVTRACRQSSPFPAHGKLGQLWIRHPSWLCSECSLRTAHLRSPSNGIDRAALWLD
jgi:hypothetical protein